MIFVVLFSVFDGSILYKTMLPIVPVILQMQKNLPRSARVPAGRRHLPYAEPAPLALVALDGETLVHKNAVGPLMNLLQAAKKDGVPLRVAAGFRSVEMQRAAYESGARKKGISLRSYAWWTAPPGFSEHHTGLAVDFTDLRKPKTDFTPATFSKTEAYAWLKSHAPEFGFELSFEERNTLRVAFEPWHWRFVGDAESRAIFAVARQGRAGSLKMEFRPHVERGSILRRNDFICPHRQCP